MCLYTKFIYISIYLFVSIYLYIYINSALFFFFQADKVFHNISMREYAAGLIQAHISAYDKIILGQAAVIYSKTNLFVNK